jgi:hypothetical protein
MKNKSNNSLDHIINVDAVSNEEMDLETLVSDKNLRELLESRINEAKLCLNYSPLASIILCGSFLEGLLLEAAKKNPEKFNRASASPKKEKKGKVKNFNEWTLEDLINVSFELEIINNALKDFCRIVQKYRNYVHPSEQLKDNFYPDKFSAEQSINIIKQVVFKLKKSFPENEINIYRGSFDDNEKYYLSLIILIGSWEDEEKADLDIIVDFLSVNHESYLKLKSDLVNHNLKPLLLNNKILECQNRKDLLSSLGSRILDDHLDKFKSTVVSVLKEKDPAFDLPKDERFMASIKDKKMNYSSHLRKGLAEGLALLSTNKEHLKNCSQGKVDEIVILAIREIFKDSDYILWGSLNYILPYLAEASPKEFLSAAQNALSDDSSAFDLLFAQEGDAITGGNYLTGLLWALECLAWEEEYLVQVCMILGKLSAKDPGGSWGNRPFKSLVKILLPWLPRTLAKSEKRYVVLKTLFDEESDIAWDLLMRLFPKQEILSSSTYTPKYRINISDEENRGVIKSEYWDVISTYLDLALSKTENKIERIIELVRIADKLNKDLFYKFFSRISEVASGVSGEEKNKLWECLIGFVKKHRKYSEADWALPEVALDVVNKIADRIAPKDLFTLHKHLFI